MQVVKTFYQDSDIGPVAYFHMVRAMKTLDITTPNKINDWNIIIDSVPSQVSGLMLNYAHTCSIIINNYTPLYLYNFYAYPAGEQICSGGVYW